MSDSCNQAQNNINVNNGGIKTTGKQVPTTGTLVVIKHVINDNGGTSTARDFTIDVSRSFPGAESPGTNVALSPGSYSVSEKGPTGYVQSLSGDCSGIINAGDSKVCTITNNDNPQTSGPSITINSFGCSPSGTSVDMTISGISHDSHPLTFQIQTFSPSGYLVKVFDTTVPDNAPDPATTHIISGSPSPPDGILVETYKIVAIINAQPISATFQVTTCS